jgi:hypothetical protein
MKIRMLAALAVSFVAIQPAAAQQPLTAPKAWVAASAVMYTTIAPLLDPGTSSRWQFDDTAFGAGLGAQYEISQGLLLGAEGTWATTSYERRALESQAVLAEGSATIATAMATGRFAYGGGGAVGIYLTGGAGAIAYNLEDVGEWNSDFALRAGTGIEFLLRRNVGAALEWNRLWAYHEKEELGGGRQNHSMLRLSLRYGL